MAAEAFAIYIEFRRIELAVDSVRDAAWFGCVTIEQHVREALAVADSSAQGIEVERQTITHVLLRIVHVRLSNRLDLAHQAICYLCAVVCIYQ
jgi:hypothetical protein